MPDSSQDALIQSLQSSTRALIGSFRDRTESLSASSKDIKKLLRQGYDANAAHRGAEKFFGQKKVSFVAIDGTESQDQQLDMLLFYAGAFGYSGQLEFMGEKCDCGEVIEADRISNISTAIPMYEEDTSNIVGQETESGTEADIERLPSVLMQFAEYYLAVKLLEDNNDLKVVILDRTLAGDVGHLIWSVGQFIKENRCMLQGLQTDFGIVSPLDLELARILHANSGLGIPASRSQFIKYAAINQLLSTEGTSEFPDFNTILNKIGAKDSRLTKLEKDIKALNQEYAFLQSKPGEKSISIRPEIKQYWERVLSATMMVARHIFETPRGEHPLVYQKTSDITAQADNGKNAEENKKWITSSDLEYMTLVMTYALLRIAWERDVLVIGLIKDTAASELLKTIVPILRSAQKINMDSQLPKFNSDKQLLQTFSVIEGDSVKAPWRTFEFDACFRTMAPVPEDRGDDGRLRTNEANVAGAYKNLISGERMFVKSYVQLWQSENDNSVRSHVFSYDRPCYPQYDKPGELLLFHNDDNTTEEIEPIIHINEDNELSHLVMDILCSMANEVIPECIGHNYPLFLADKKAKYILNQMRTAYLATIAFEMANSEFDQQILYGASFRDFRSEIENSRRSRK